MNNISRIVPTTIKLQNIQFVGISDVNTRLLGNNGCVELFSAQKGVKPENKSLFERGLIKYFLIILNSPLV